MPVKKDLLIIAAVLLVAAALFAVSKSMPKTDLTQKTAEATMAPDAVTYLDETEKPEAIETPVATQTPAAEATAEPAATEAPEANEAPAATKAPEAAGPVMQGPGPMPRAQETEVRGYVVIKMQGRQYGDPIPMDRDKVITLRQEDGKINCVHITPEMVWMESSTCENQDCVGEGEITLDNYKTRILSTWIICLPNEVTVEFVPADE